MRHLRHSLVAATVVMLASVQPLSAQQANDPVIGTWVFNAAKSKYAKGADVPTSATRMYEVKGGKLHSTGQTKHANGSVDKYEFTAAYDGKDSPYTGNEGDHIAITLVNDHVISAVVKKGGKVAIRTRREVSADGKTLTLAATTTDASGKSTTNVSVYDRK